MPWTWNFFFFFFHTCTLHINSITQNIFINIQSNHMIILAICDNMAWLVWPNIWCWVSDSCDASIIRFLWMFMRLISLGVIYSLYNFPKKNIFDNMLAKINNEVFRLIISDGEYVIGCLFNWKRLLLSYMKYKIII
jgi:hypothetical protein